MAKTILITGSTDGIGLVTAEALLKLGHTVLLHGRSEQKLAKAKQQLSALTTRENQLFSYKADLSVFKDVVRLANDVGQAHSGLDVLINNAGVFVVPSAVTADGLDTRFMVNTIAPYLLTQLLLPSMTPNGRVVNLSSAAQAPVSPDELEKPSVLGDSAVYAKSKLALTMWSRQLGLTLGTDGPVIVAVNPKSFLGSKMVEQAYGVAGGNLQLGADILVRAATSEEFADATGLYFDNDSEKFSSPHADALNDSKIAEITEKLAAIVKRFT